MLGKYQFFPLIISVLILLNCNLLKCSEFKENWIVFKSRNYSSNLLIISSLNTSLQSFKNFSSLIPFMSSCNVFYDEKIENFSPEFHNSSTKIDLDESLLNELKQYCISKSSSKLIYRWPEFLKHLIFPGTKWCGSGNSSSNYDDLGEHNDTDACCRDHDHCPNYIRPFHKKYDLYNNFTYISFHCDCEKQFYNCLKNNSDKTSDIIGKTYFNVLNRKCFEFNYLIIRCEILTSVPFGKKCIQYTFDHYSKKQFQFFDSYLY